MAPLKPKSKPLRVLIVRVGAMGDVLHGMPAVAALRVAMPDAEIGWAIEPKWASLLRSSTQAKPKSNGMPLVDVVHEVPTKAWSKAPVSWKTLRSVRALRRELRARQYDVAIDLQGSIRSSLIARMSGAKVVVGKAAPREKQARWFYNERVKVTRANVVEQAAELVSAAVKQPLQPVKAPLPLDLVAEDWCDELFAGLPHGPVVLLAPTAGWGAKEWPAARYGWVARQLADRGCTVLVNASPVGADSIANLVVACAQGRARVVPCTLPQLAAMVQRVDLLIAGDSGPLHLAAAASVPALGLYGPTDPTRNGPWGMRSRVLRHRLSITSYKRNAETERGLMELDAVGVLDAALEMLAGVLA